VGTVMTNGLNAGGPTPPGPAVGGQNYAIVGGTGAFLGARGQKGNASGAASPPIRLASIVEDPGNRRQNGGGHVVFALYVIPMSRPEIVITASGPAVTHSNDFSLVSASKPVAAGEIVSLFATGLGPTRPGLDPGQPFPPSPLAVVNSPVEVMVNGKPAEVLAAVGYPGAVDGYQVNFRVPSDTAKGTVFLQVSAAWIPGAPVSIPVQWHWASLVLTMVKSIPHARHAEGANWIATMRTNRDLTDSQWATPDPLIPEPCRRKKFAVVRGRTGALCWMEYFGCCVLARHGPICLIATHRIKPAIDASNSG
jgi:hypothetical protein